MKSVSLVFSLIGALLFFSCVSAPDPETKNQAEAYNKIGYSYLDSGRLNEAHLEFQKALKLNPTNKETLNYLGYIQYRFENYEEAISYYKRAISIDPKYSDALNSTGVAYAALENWDEAIKYFQAALDNPMYGTPARAFSNMGFAYYKKGDYDSAESSLKEALLRNPIHPRAMYILGMAYGKRGDTEAAIEEYKKAIGIQPDYVEAHWELGKAYLNADRKAKAMKHFSLVIEKDDNLERRREALGYMEQLKY